jgi:hypothetical protein
MRAHRVRVRVPENHELRVTLPSDFPPGDAEVIVLEAAQDESLDRTPKLTVEAFLAGKLTPPPGVSPVTLGDIERAIAEGASGDESV